MGQIKLSETIYSKIQSEAARQNQTPDRFVEELLAAHLLPDHPYIEVIQGTGGARPVIKGTRVGVDVIAGYSQAGYTPQTIAAEILPHLSLAQIYDALSYVEDHRPQIEALLEANQPDRWQARIKAQLGQPAAANLLGE